MSLSKHLLPDLNLFVNPQIESCSSLCLPSGHFKLPNNKTRMTSCQLVKADCTLLGPPFLCRLLNSPDGRHLNVLYGYKYTKRVLSVTNFRVFVPGWLKISHCSFADFFLSLSLPLEQQDDTAHLAFSFDILGQLHRCER